MSAPSPSAAKKAVEMAILRLRTFYFCEVKPKPIIGVKLPLIVG
jgi:hypothetical protein